MAKTPSTLIVDADVQARFETKQVVRASGLTMAGECGFGMEAASTASELQPDIILVGVGEPMERPIQTIESLQAFMPETPILVYSVTRELDTIRKAMMAGAKDFLARPIKPETLRNSVLSALLAEEKKRLRQMGQIPTSATTGTIVTVFGAKGGIGKSTVSANLAVAMAQMERSSVCLVDLDDGFADLADMLDVKPERTLFDLVRDLDMIEREDIARYVARHQFTPLDLMAGPSLLDWRKLHRDDVRRAIELLSRNYDTVILDTSGSLNELMEMAVEVATIVLWVTTTEYASVKDSIEAMRILRKLSFSSERVRIVMNAVSPDDGVAPTVVQEALQRDVFWTVPYDKKVRQSTHLGQPAVITAPNSAAARSLSELARSIAGAGPEGERDGRIPALKWKPRTTETARSTTRNARSIEGRMGHIMAIDGRTREQFRIERIEFDTAEHDEEWFDAVHAVHQRMLQEMDLQRIERLDAASAREAVSVASRQLVTELFPSLLGDDRERVIKRVIDEAIGYGPVQALIDDDSISEVMVNAPEEVYFERDGVIYRSPLKFKDNDHVMRIIERIVSPLGRRVDESMPYVDARLPDGSRVNVIIPPLAPRSPTITIRKFRREKFKMPELIANETVTEMLAKFLQACVKQRLNIVISGGTGTGKTTLLNALSSYVPDNERIVTIEDPIEMKLQQSHVIALEARPPNIEGKNEVTQRDLVRNALRMRPDRILVGEVRGAESFDMLQAMNTGHEGSLTTIHANSPRDAIIRIENMVMMAGFDLPIRAIREQIISALQIIIQLARFPDGRRRVTQVTEIIGRDGDSITTQDLFVFRQAGMDDQGHVRGTLDTTGITPTFEEQFALSGVTLEFLPDALSRETAAP